MGFWDDNAELLQLSQPTVGGDLFDGGGGNQAPGGVNPALMGGNTGFTGGAGGQPNIAPQAGQFAGTNQGFLDWATKQYGADPTRGQGFVNAQAGGGLQTMLGAYTKATGNQATFQGGPSGDRVDFGQGTQDAITSGGSIWNAQGGGGQQVGGGGQGLQLSGLNGGGGGGWNGGGGGMPTAPGVKDLKAPDPFTYQASNLGQFQGPKPYEGAGNVPTAQPLSYNAMATPDQFTAQQVGTPDKLTYQNQAAAPTLNYQEYNGAPGDSSYKFRFDQGLNATQNTLGHAGALRTGAAAKALTDYGQGMASTEYAAEDARRRANVGMNNQNALNFGNANFQNQFQVGAANNAGNMQATQGNNTNALNAANANNASNQAAFQNNFNNAFSVNQANNQGQNAVTQQNNQNAFNQQGQQYQQGSNTQNQAFQQSLAGYGANQAAQQQGYNQALGAYGQNASTQLAYGSQNQNNQLANYNAQVGAALGQGNLNLGYQNSNNSYNLGMGNLALNQQGQQFGQNLATYQQNYQANVTDPWNHNYQLASLGNPGAPNTQQNANQQSDIYQGQGNANAASQIAQGNANAGAWNNLGNIAAGAYGSYQNRPQTQRYQPGNGQALYR